MMLRSSGLWPAAMHEGSRLLAALISTALWGGLHLLLHEVGHMLAAWAVGSRVTQVGVSRVGPFVRRTAARTPLRNAIVALAGPGLNLFTWVVFVWLSWPHPWIALALGLMNLLPLRNSDLNKAMAYLHRGNRHAEQAHFVKLD